MSGRQRQQRNLTPVSVWLPQYLCLFLSAGQPGQLKKVQASVTAARKVFRIMRVSTQQLQQSAVGSQPLCSMPGSPLRGRCRIARQQPLTVCLFCFTSLLLPAPGVVDAPAGAAWPDGQAAPAPGAHPEGEQQRLAYLALVGPHTEVRAALW